ncbi:4-galactosyl-N-acetylglucosaminide 3-alpha-L-fucosyltransferase 9-like [Trachinotus anak]|uniref:4-galactosyl-N-acetylglucosaminide 3-alpha-L-fucosyltransferase 9-like n=1 Tax=Trachinotus anak TaxID=443729 RepID=UPI0039F2320D
MASSPSFSGLRAILIVTLVLAGAIVLLLMYYTPLLSAICRPPLVNSRWQLKQPNSSAVTDKPVVLLWFWPEKKSFDLQDCKKLFNIDSCHLTDDRSMYSRAEAVLIFHRAISDDLSNLPTSPRPRFQRWIWFNMDPPTNTRKIEGIQGLFNLTLSYRKDADIHIRWKLTAKKKPAEDFVLPKKERLLCWIVDNNDVNTTAVGKYSYYKELIKYIKVDVLYNSSAESFKGEDYFQMISSCKFFLSFENSIHKDYITETFSGPLAVGTVPIVLGPPRHNYEDFVPGTSFIHVNDFPDAMKLADLIIRLDEDNEAYMQYFNWRRFYTVRRHLTENYEFALPICQACHYVHMNKEYRAVPDLYKWFL